MTQMDEISEAAAKELSETFSLVFKIVENNADGIARTTRVLAEAYMKEGFDRNEAMALTIAGMSSMGKK